ncbi:hypothetical protein G1K46_01845 [Tenacibaculum finnmarkense]|uniref:hypothetical protein n=1 Tax=Tenacibaculum finnmarkense TaxID=2781243 RepID=UPI00187B8611|nr:hypothetical protein [Tenacibaculum finnmarkense]MBE7645012.1 hypothetical protein [Tenacibaculum finnmarkense genomovar ulcerans]MCG8761478.1 hypothetical protein [Tenacibaculum finnmarkense]MCG8786852.1 hypothetical protein [Tenacibaculum finnmarkense]MCG8794723.1 hypothetical protein [Tenacibaculum finnmarkense]MCG8797051.1 hypothetical protein [Tenacibaculum finnmarkense]
MKNIITLFTFTLLTIISVNAQRKIDSLTYENTQDINFFKKIKNRTLVQKYKTVNENVIRIGDTISLGNPTSQEFSSKTYSGSYGSRARGGVSKSRSTTKKTYEFVKMGRPAGFGSIMASLNGDAQTMASNRLKNTKAIVKEIKAYHRGSKKKPLYLIMVLGEINGRAFGINKYLSVMDTELAIESGEVLLKNRKVTREEAISKLKEAKELMDIDMMSKAEFENLKKELAPIIRKNM